MAGLVISVGSMVAGQAVAGWVLGAAALDLTIGATLLRSAVGAVAAGLVGKAATSVFGGGAQQAPQSSVLAARANGQPVNIASTDEPIPLYYGFNYNVPSLVVYKEVDSESADWLYRIHIVGEGEIEAFDAAWIDGTLSTDARFTGLVEFEYHTGADAQAASALLLAAFPAKWSVADIGGGIAYAVTKIKNDATAFPAGEPLVTFDIRGRKVKDTRDGVTRFSPNPALAIRDYWVNARYGRKVAEAKIVDAKITTEADYFDGRETVPASALAFTADAGNDELSFEKDAPFDNGDGVNLTTTGVLPAGLALATTYYFIRLDAQRGKLATSYANALARTAIDITDAGSGTGAHTCNHVDQPRYTCNGGLDPTADPYANLDRLRSSCRSWLFDSAGSYHLVCDKTTAPSATFSFDEDNICDILTIDLGGEDGHYNRVTAGFLDVAHGVKPNVATSDSTTERTDDGGKLMEGRLALEFTTNLYMAQRIAQMERRKSRLGLTAVHTVMQAGFQAFPGEIYYHTHSAPAWTNKMFRLLRIDLAGNDEYEVQVAEYSDDVYVNDEQSAMTIPARTNLPDPSVVSAPSGVTLASGESELTRGGDGTVTSRIKVSWTAPADSFVTNGGEFECQARRSSESTWQSASNVSGSMTALWLATVEDGVAYDVRLRARNVLGACSAWVQFGPHTVVGKTEPPEDVPWFSINAGELAWGGVPDLDLAGYRIRYQPGINFSYGNAMAMHNGLVAAPPFAMPVASGGQVTILIKAVDTSGNESENAAYIVTDLGDALVANVVETIDLAADGWPGNITQGAIDGSNHLVADDASGLIWNEDEEAAMWSYASNAMWHGSAYYAMYYVAQLWPSQAGVGSRMTLAHTITAANYAIEYRRNGPAPMWLVVATELMWDADAATQQWTLPPGDFPANMWSGDANLIWAADTTKLMWTVLEGGYQSWPGSVEVLNEPYDVRVTTGFGETRGTVSALTFTVDLPDIVERLNDVVIAAGGTRLPISESYRDILNVALTVQNDGNGAVGARIEDKSPSLGPLVKTINDAGVAVAGLIDATIQGF